MVQVVEVRTKCAADAQLSNPRDVGIVSRANLTRLWSEVTLLGSLT